MDVLKFCFRPSGDTRSSRGYRERPIFEGINLLYLPHFLINLLDADANPDCGGRSFLSAFTTTRRGVAMTPDFAESVGASVDGVSEVPSKKVVLKAEDLAFGVSANKPRTVDGIHFPKRVTSRNYSADIVTDRQSWIEGKVDARLPSLFSGVKDFSAWKSSVENPIGWCQIPIGVVGPLAIRNKDSRRNYYVPFATTQGTMIGSYQRGALAIEKSGGASVKVIRDQIDIDPVFVFEDLFDAAEFYNYLLVVDLNFLNGLVSSTSRFAKLLSVQPNQVGNYVLVRCTYHCGEAMGLNMMTIATFSLAQFFLERFPSATYFPRSNYTSDKKTSCMNILNSYGKEVVAEVDIPKEVLSRYLATNPKNFEKVWKACLIGSYQGGVFGHNAQVANAVAAIFLATGQDIAQVSNSTTAFTFCELSDVGVRVSLKFHSLPVATIGGGTTLPSQNDALKMLDCIGPGGAVKLAEIIAVAALAGEISLIATIASNSHAKADLALRSR